MTSFQLHNSNNSDSVLFSDAILFLPRLPCSKGTWACLRYAHIKSCNSSAGFDANIGSERSLNTFQLGGNVWVKKRAYETFSKEDSVLAFKGSAAAIKRKKVSSQKFLPAYHKAKPCFFPLRKGSVFVLCTTCKSDFYQYHASMVVDLTVSNLLRASLTRSSRWLESFF